MSKFKILTVAVGFAFVAVACLVHFVRPVHAEQTPFFVFGVTGIIPSETARLHVVSVGLRDAIPAQLVFLDGQGSILMQSAVELVPGRSVSLDLPFIERSASGNRLSFYTRINLLSKPDKDGYVVSTLEVIDNNTGRTIRVIVDPEG